ncbi:hypothetical protein [Microvirga ossetica]|nr:hypothetical protein [Microvirga ossetica]
MTLQNDARFRICASLAGDDIHHVMAGLVPAIPIMWSDALVGSRSPARGR